ncbi:DUF885 domain-containing protein [Shewanella surugensis]|uniref:DUF885 domain-containing protein n=1 Tax=Shewanella surugensis TaxID=212020 RepID=A0ABT0L849_9GAMM|nr:DUF885 domain-containing protein [Shewanella surugensis]MCL1123873.1 DUF885 domain-containing protein [Shewanella surugensis]
MVKRMLRRLSLALLALSLLLGAFVTHEWFAQKPFMFRVFLDRSLLKVVLKSPETLTSLGFLESMGFTAHNGELNNDSPEEMDVLLAQLDDLKATLLSYDDAYLDENEQLSKDISLYLLDFIIASKAYRYHNYPVNQLFGVQNDYPSFMASTHQIHDVEGAEYYLSRLEKVKVKFAQNLEGLKIREQKGIIPPKFVIERVLTEMNAFIDTPVTENILYTELVDKIDSVTDFPLQDKERILLTARVHIQDSVYPAYNLFIHYFSILQSKAVDDAGFWHLPNGDKAYQQALKFFTTTDLTAEEIHQLGLAEVARIQTEIVSILETQGYDVSEGFTQGMAALSNEPAFYYEDSDAGRAQILQDYDKILAEINQGIGKAFMVKPKALLEVVRIPEFKEKTAPGAYYQQPAIDGSRPGRFFANLYDIKATPKYSMRTLAYHEGVPGHHFQLSVAMELESMPFIRKMAPFVAYAEGWALYSEQVAWELGYQADPFDNIGRLQAELFRAVRLVVDTGIHYKRWTREAAIEYMLVNTGMPETDVVAEIERYIVMPGQATAYKIGMMKILSLREKAKLDLGEKFDLREFHDVILKNGAMPLTILERVVDNYIAARSLENDRL